MQEEQPKSEDNPITEDVNFNNPSYAFIPNGVHRYRQQGYFLVCQSCELSHAVFIGSKKIMVGEDKKGRPIIKLRKEVGMV